MSTSAAHRGRHSSATARLAGIGGLALATFGLGIAISRAGATADPPIPKAAEVSGPAIEAALDRLENFMSRPAPASKTDGVAASGQRPTEPSGPTTGADEEWERLPRTDRLVDEVKQAAKLDANRLFRNRQLNSRDTYLSPWQRESLAILLRPYRDLFREIDEIEATIMQQELHAAVEQNLATTLIDDITTSPLAKPAPAAVRETIRQRAVAAGQSCTTAGGGISIPVDELSRKAGFPISAIDYREGRLRAVPIEAMPRTLVARQARGLRMEECANLIVTWFVQHQTCAPDDGNALIARARDTFLNE